MGSIFTLSELKSPKNLNIFTDASIKSYRPKDYIGCFGAIAVTGDSIIEKSYNVTGRTTNNNSEIKAIRSGIELAIKHGSGKRINLFSDSQICIFGLRERIMNWKLRNGNYYGSVGAIANQEVFSEIVDIILQYQLQINFFHQSGHVPFTGEGLKAASHVFHTSNNIRGMVDMNVIRYISSYNNLVDVESRNMLHNLFTCKIVDGISFTPHPFDVDAYRKLVSLQLQ